MSGKGVIEAEARWAEAILKRDGRQLKFLVHPSFLFVGLKTAGLASWTRQEWVAAIAGIEFIELSHTVRDLQVFSCVAVATVEGRWRARIDGDIVAERFLMTDVWNRAQSGAWQVVRRHSSRYVEGSDGAQEDGMRLALNVELHAPRPRTPVPEALAPETGAPETRAPETRAPETEDVFL